MQLQKIKNFYNGDKKIIFLSVLLGFLIATSTAIHTKARALEMQERIAEEIIRFHVLANSDSKDDQDLKMRVKEEVLYRLEPKFGYIKNIDETRKILLENLKYIETIVHEVVGSGYNISVNISNVMFPKISYENMTLPAGEYESLQIIIGEGVGQNWWCVMFPMLCFVTSEEGEVSYEMRTEMRRILSEEEYNLIFQDEINIRFKAIDWWQNRNTVGNVHVF